MDHPLRLARRSRCVEDEEGIVAGDGNGRQGAGEPDLLLKVREAAFLRGKGQGGSFPRNDEGRSDRWESLAGGAGRFEEGDALAAPEGTVRGHENLGFEVFEAASEGGLGEARKNDRMDGAQAGAGQHGDDLGGRWREKDRDPVSLADSEFMENLREPDGLVEKAPIGENLFLAPVSGPDEGDLVRKAVPHMPVEGVVADVSFRSGQPAAFEGLRIPVENLPVGLCEVEVFRKSLPEGIRIVHRSPVDALVIRNPALPDGFRIGNEEGRLGGSIHRKAPSGIGCWIGRGSSGIPVHYKAEGRR